MINSLGLRFVGTESAPDSSMKKDCFIQKERVVCVCVCVFAYVGACVCHVMCACVYVSCHESVSV